MKVWIAFKFSNMDYAFMNCWKPKRAGTPGNIVPSTVLTGRAFKPTAIELPANRAGEFAAGDGFSSPATCYWSLAEAGFRQKDGAESSQDSVTLFKVSHCSS